jgi:aminoglycoside phosphotransferase (APT) family kinase protein
MDDDTGTPARDAPLGTAGRRPASARPHGEPHGELHGIDTANVTAWLEQHVADTRGPFEFEIIAGGHSNLTYRVVDASGRRLVLRRPPLGHVLASAHDMTREHRILSALQSTAIPVPPVLGLCTDDEVNGAPFYVMGFVDGHVVRDADTAATVFDVEARANAGRSLVDTIAAIHDVDIAAVGLSELGRHDGYIERQLKRWYGQWNQGKTRELPAVDRVHDRLLERIPDQGPAAIVHGDYRLDNCLADGDGNIVAVLDWEICTLGDPLADVGLLQVYWTGPDDDASAWSGSATTVDGFWNRADLIARYGEVSGRDLGQLDFYVAFAYWKLACILEGVYSRYLGGALGERTADELAPFKAQVGAAAERAEEFLESLG